MILKKRVSFPQLFSFFLLFVHFPFLSKGQIPAGYYNGTSGLNGAQLKTALHKIIRNHTKKTYDYLWTAFATTDDKPNGTVWDIYSDIPDGTANGNPPYVFCFGTNQCSATPGFEGVCYNREHSFPKSWFGGIESDTMYTDLFHLYPTDSKVNSMRNNYPYGEVSSPSWTSQNGGKLGPNTVPGYSGVVFEPRNEFKGDLARTYFYMATRYESCIASWQIYSGADDILDGTSFPCFDTWFLNMLIDWNNNDPVSQKEIDRNNDICNLHQHNRNPFIDHPEFVNLIWGSGIPSVLPEPSNHAASFSGNALSNHITLNWNDNDGTQPAIGFLIMAGTSGNFPDPTDGTDPADDNDLSDGTGLIHVLHGVQTYDWTSLNQSTTYFFRIYTYTNSDSNINFKTDGVIPFWSATTLSGGSSGDVFISEYLEGSSNNKAIEICNAGNTPVSLASLTVKLYANGSLTPNNTWTGGAGFLNPGSTYVLYNSSANPAIIAAGNVASTVCNFNGDDALELICNGTTADIFGIIGSDPGTSWTIAGNPSASVDKTVIRKLSTNQGTTNWSTSAGNNASDAQWVIIPTTDYSENLNSFGTVWRGQTSSSWNTGSNWDMDVPSSGINAIIPDVPTKPVISTSSAIRNLTVKTGAGLTISSSGSLTVSGDLLLK